MYLSYSGNSLVQKSYLSCIDRVILDTKLVALEAVERVSGSDRFIHALSGAGVVKLVDTVACEASGRKTMRVRVPSPAR